MCDVFLKQLITKTKKNLICSDGENFTIQEHIHLSYNIRDNLHYFGTIAEKDSSSKQVGLFHPYHPDTGFPETPIALELPMECRYNLPVEIKQLLEEHKAEHIYIRPFFQNMPWKDNKPLLIRPNHVIFEPTEENKLSYINGTFSVSQSCKIALYPTTLENTTIEKGVDSTSLGKLSPLISFTSHPSGTGYTLCSPGGIGIVHNIDYNKTYTFYSVIVTSENKWYVSPVTLLNSVDFAKIIEITTIKEINTVWDLLTELIKEEFRWAVEVLSLLKIDDK